MLRFAYMLTLSLAGCLVFAGAASARPPVDGDVRSVQLATLEGPAYCQVEHNVGNLNLTVTNYGITGQGRSQTADVDCFTGLPTQSWEFPSGARTRYLFSSCFWVGAVAGTDTLVSTGYEPQSYLRFEWHPEESPEGDIVYRSVNEPSLPGGDSAVSEQDYISVFYDTCVLCSGGGSDDETPHTPLGLKITQRSYAWSYAHTEDFVLFDCTIENTGTSSLKDVYVGQFVDGDVYHLDNQNSGWEDDETGFLGAVPGTFPPDPCAGGDSIRIAWMADNNGDLSGLDPPVPDVMGLRLLFAPKDSLRLSYNWWTGNFSTVDYGPQARTSFRDFQTGGLGTPLTDRNRYHILRNGEIDFDQYFTSRIPLDDPVWLPPNQAADDAITTGMDSRFSLAAGPYQLEPGEEVPFVMAYVAGEGFHRSGSNFKNLPRFPYSYRGNLDFSDLVHNALWAGWVYDNPGVDTDNDGYRGEYRMCEGDTFWYQGDGVADFKAVEPPGPPVTWLESVPEGLRLRWNGWEAEKAKDFLQRAPRFEGYNAYIAPGAPPADFVKLASYDIEDYYKYYWDAAINDWRLTSDRFTAREVRCLYAPEGCTDTAWSPLDFPRSTPLVLPESPDSVFYFEAIYANAFRFGLETPFVKRFPDSPEPPYDRVSEVPSDSTELYLTDDGYFKYYEYEYTITDLLPGEQYTIALTSFDYGSFVPGAEPLESAIGSNSYTAIAGGGSACCVDPVGNIDCDSENTVDIADLQTLVDHQYLTLDPLCCTAEADLDGRNGVDMIDLQLLIDHLLLSHAPLGSCPRE